MLGSLVSEKRQLGEESPSPLSLEEGNAGADAEEDSSHRSGIPLNENVNYLLSDKSQVSTEGEDASSRRGGQSRQKEKTGRLPPPSEKENLLIDGKKTRISCP